MNEEKLLGKLAKLDFAGLNQNGTIDVEYIWVEIRSIEGENKLCGKLIEDPTLMHEFGLNDLVFFNVSDIKDLKNWADIY